MVGAGIFALLGEAGAVAGSAVWLSFLLAGLVSSLLGYTVVKLGVRYPSSGGLIAYLMRLVDRAQSLIVLLLLGVFAVFIVVTLVNVDWDLLAFSGYPAFSDIVASVALTFFAYLGFSVITFAAGDLRDPTRELPKAMYSALGLTTLLYVLSRSESSGR
jgi:amino acid transporter